MIFTDHFKLYKILIVRFYLKVNFYDFFTSESFAIEQILYIKKLVIYSQTVFS